MRPLRASTELTHFVPLPQKGYCIIQEKLEQQDRWSNDNVWDETKPRNFCSAPVLFHFTRVVLDIGHMLHGLLCFKDVCRTISHSHIIVSACSSTGTPAGCSDVSFFWMLPLMVIFSRRVQFPWRMIVGTSNHIVWGYSWRLASPAAHTTRPLFALLHRRSQRVDVVWFEKLQSFWWGSQLGDALVHLEATAVDLGGKLKSPKIYIWAPFWGPICGHLVSDVEATSGYAG